MSAACAKGQALEQAKISYDRFNVIAMADEAMDEVKRQEMKEEPQALNQALGGNDLKLLKSLTWCMRRNPQGWSAKHTNAMHWLQHSSLKSAWPWRLQMALRTVYV